MASKADIRKHMLAQRAILNIEAHQQRCGYVCDKLSSIPLAESSIIAVYFAINNEIDSKQYVELCWQRNNQVLLPIVTKPELIMQFKPWKSDSALEQGAYGIAQPAGGEVMLPNVILVPLVAFDRRGFRVGYGKGHYDATISALKHSNPSLLTIGIAASFQEVDAVSNEPHDAALNMIVTDKEIIHCQPEWQ